MRVLVSVLFTGVLALCMRSTHEACEESSVYVEIVAGDRKRSIGENRKFRVDYGVNITIFCTGSDSKNLHMDLNTGTFVTTDRGIHDTEIINMTTVKLIVVNPAIESYQYTCRDVDTTCAELFNVNVFPVITIVSPNVSFSYGEKYYVPVGLEYEVVCSGNPSLSIKTFEYEDIQSLSVNETTTKSIKKTRKNNGDAEVYSCINNEHPILASYLFLYPGPAAKDFLCIEIDLQINCTWLVVGMDTTFTLFYMDKYGNSIRLNAYEMPGTNSWRSEWGLKNVMQQGLEYHNDINLVLESCLYFYCVNQTYNIDRTSIMKSTSPVGLEVVETGSQMAVVIWTYKEDYPVEYTITYQLPGMEWMQELKASSQENCKGRDCKIELKLPCPEVLYQLKIYAKSKTVPQKPEYWSDPATTTFHADSQDTTDAVDPMCYEEPESIINKYVGEHKVKEFRKSFMKDGTALYGKIETMKRTLDTIKRLMRNV